MESFVTDFNLLTLYAGSILLAISLFAWVGLAIGKVIDLGKVRRLAAFLLRPTFSALMAWLCVGPFVFTMIVRGGSKTGDTNATPRRVGMHRVAASTMPEATISADDIAKGFRVVTSLESPGIVALSAGAVTNESLRLRGGFDWAFRIEPPGWSFPWRDGILTGVTVIARGEVRPNIGTSYFPVPITNGVSLLPEALWGSMNHAESQRRGDGSVLWHGVTEDDSLLVTWENALVGRNLHSPTNMQLELCRDGSFAWRTEDGVTSYLPVLPFDYDGDGLENTVDPEPLVANDVDAHGSNDEWLSIVCSNLFESVDGSLSWKADVNTNAYYFVDVVAADGPAPIYFNADRASRLGSPSIVAMRGETNRVPLLVGVEYSVTSTVPFFVSIPEDSHATVTRSNDLDCTVKWPIEFEFSENLTSSGRFYTVGVMPFDPGGTFSWNSTGDSTRSFTSSFQIGCSCASGSGNVLSFACTNSCTCGGSCGYIDSSSINISKRSTRVWLTVTAYGGPHGGTFVISSSNFNKLRVITGESIVFPMSRTLAVNESFSATCVYEAVNASDNEGDISVAGYFVEEGGQMINSADDLTSVKISLFPVDTIDGLPNRHQFGIGETLCCTWIPAVSNLQVQCRNGCVEERSYALRRDFRCPLASTNDILQVVCGTESYVPITKVVVPSSIEARQGEELYFNVLDGYPGGVGIAMDLYVLPDTVSFKALEFIEQTSDDSVIEGYFTDTRFASLWYHDEAKGAGVWRRIQNQNFWFRDYASMGDQLLLPYSKGRIVWNIPIEWRERENYDFIPVRLEVVPQTFDMNDNGTLRVQKYQYWAERLPSGIRHKAEGVR